MKNNPLITILLGVLTVSALLSVGLCWRYISNARELRMLQGQATLINNNRALINALAADVLEYSKKNTAINPILESVHLKPTASALPTNKPASR